MTAVTIEVHQRDAIYEQILDRLRGAADDFFQALDSDDFETADRRGRELSDGLGLILDDLGWGYGSAASAIPLTMSNDDLHRAVTDLRATAEAQRESEEREEAEDDAHQIRDRARVVIETCDQVLEIVGRVPPGEGNTR